MEHIQAEGLLHLRPEDYKPYPTAQEPSWQTDIAWSRKNAVMVGYVNNHEWNSWELARLGREFLCPILTKFDDGSLSVSRCFLFSPQFKRRLNSSYQPSPLDSVAPAKGSRSLPNIDECRVWIEDMLQVVTIEELATRISGKLGVYIPPTRPSVAFAYHLWKQQAYANL